MRKYLTGIILASAISLGGCAGLTPSTLQTDITRIVAEVRTAAAALCGFVPTASSIISVWNAAAGATVAGVAGSICSVLVRAAPITTAASRQLVGPVGRTLYCSGKICGYRA